VNLLFDLKKALVRFQVFSASHLHPVGIPIVMIFVKLKIGCVEIVVLITKNPVSFDFENEVFFFQILKYGTQLVL
jgi:hypothetical protein